MALDELDPNEEGSAPVQEDAGQPEAVTEAERKLVRRIERTILADKDYHKDAYKRMIRDMRVAMWGAEESWNENSYKANISGRHVKQKTAALYAKNPKAVARRAERLDFAIWDEDPQSLMLAYQTVQAGSQAMVMMAQQQALAPPNPLAADPSLAADPMTADMVDPTMAADQDPAIATPALGSIDGSPPTALQQPGEPVPGFNKAMETIQDFMQGMEARRQIDKIGKTMEVLFARALREQKPLDFKTAMKQTVRRACTTGVAYAELGFQRDYGPTPDAAAGLSDARTRMDHMQRLIEDAQTGEIEEMDAEMAELQASMAALEAEPEVVIREGLVFDFPSSTKVIPDRRTKKLVGFVGAAHVTIECEYSVEEVKETFHVDLKVGGYKKYSIDGEDEYSPNVVYDDEYGPSSDATKPRNDRMVRVWKHYDKRAGLVYYIAEGHPKFLRPPAAPDVFVEDFWPVYALTFNAVESEKDLFPPSDVSLMLPMQNEYNRSRQGLREHREAARPRWVFPNGSLDAEDIEALKKMKPFDAIGVNLPPEADINKILMSVPVPGVDPNLYETGPIFSDTQMVVGSQEAQFGGVSKATATETAIAANSSNSSDQSSVDDLDAFLTCIARSSGQILLREMSEEQVKVLVGPGALWPHMSLADIAEELFLEVEAGSSGKPNQAVEINNWQTMLPFLIQMGGIKPEWLARETLKRLDDRMDLTSALAAGIPSIVAMNSQKQPGPADPGANPAQQGSKGQGNAPAAPGGSGGSGPAFGSNQV